MLNICSIKINICFVIMKKRGAIIQYLINIYEAVILSNLHKVFRVKRCRILILRTRRAKMKLGARRRESLLQSEDVSRHLCGFLSRSCRVAKTSFPLVRTNRCHFPLPWRGNIVLARHFYLSSREYRALPVYRTNVQSIIRQVSPLQPLACIAFIE